MEIVDETINVDISAKSDPALLASIFIREGRMRERERIVQLLMTRYEDGCCCDSAAFGDHYLSHKQPDNLIDMILSDSNC